MPTFAHPQGQDGVDVLCGLPAAVGRRPGRAVARTAEGDDGHPVLGFDPAADRVVLTGDPDVGRERRRSGPEQGFRRLDGGGPERRQSAEGSARRPVT
ncbi:hypothetical protein ACFV1L_23090 [Kitasatospora sp. NPDC059646]|uniref:hypothetical protein n=1 Tax=Kitasatospora sp. NPDC059646 TaxID=3346893 RepID=UPI0036C95D15